MKHEANMLPLDDAEGTRFEPRRPVIFPKGKRKGKSLCFK